MRSLADGLARIAHKAIFGVAPEAFLAFTGVADLEAWTATADTLPAKLLRHVMAEHRPAADGEVALMPAPGREFLAGTIAQAIAGDPGFATAPTWQGQPVETGALARMCGHPLVAACATRYGRTAVTRIVARIAELAAALEDLRGGVQAPAAVTRVQSIALGAGTGLGAVETARGLLLHRARVHDECVVDYQIVAPTEWNFHPQGPLVRTLTGSAASDESDVLRQARLAVHTLDPCVACKVEVAHA
jgi:hypothetical protein